MREADPELELHYNYYDITVASGTTSKLGRVWSKRWALSLPDANNNFNGAFYVFAPDLGSTTGDVTRMVLLLRLILMVQDFAHGTLMFHSTAQEREIQETQHKTEKVSRMLCNIT